LLYLFVKFLELIGLRRKTPPSLGLRPHRDLVLPIDIDLAYERALYACGVVLGANIYLDDPAAGTIEAGFGLVNQERVRASFESVGATQTRVRIEAQYPAGLQRPERSRAVDALADALESGVRT
jgi:hypothetical protein